ncbi:fluoride efflux transporter CrcB [Paraburkholderia terrae]|uniref:fluoride efflux transporter CrcB n=1 Tax=Paraburkholderia terrae TaxID=311230 RepID=UPI00296B38A1|nr:fluoride efflux transporter CrcB [Paraburkholderia terrae]MDW3660665.1 fluoride efflux transporter CrcB [Paraburkholderia terrae]
MITSLLAIGLGGATGSLIRWRLGLRLNALYPDLPPGTLAANLTAGFVIGLAVGFFSRYPAASVVWKLFVITGLMGGLSTFSTFSTFSAEVTAHIQQGRFGWALLEVVVHVSGSALMTALGLYLASLLPL